MKRRTFLSLSALSAAPLAARAEAEDPSQNWYETIQRDALAWKAVAEEGDLSLLVELMILPEDEVTERKDEKGEFAGYFHKGNRMPERFTPGSTLIKRFDLHWDGKDMKIPERFWNDLVDMCIKSSSLDLEKLPPEHQRQAQEFLDSLWQPRVSLSAEGGTVLIEWERGEECDSSSTIRWIISKSGTVLRHRHCPPHEC